MNTTTISIAGITVKINLLYEKNICFFSEYVSVNDHDFEITITDEDIALEKSLSAEEDKREGREIREFSNEYLETLACLRKLADCLVDYNVLLLHGSAISFEGNGVIFSADSGTGKSTHTRLWREVFDDKVTVVNDDKPFVKVSNEGVQVFGSPWDGKHHLSNNICVPLKALCLLNRGNQDASYKGQYPDFYYRFINNVYIPEDTTKAQIALKVADEMIRKVETYHLYCTMQKSAAEVSCSSIFGGMLNEIK